MLSTLAHHLGTQFADPFATLYREMASEDFTNGQTAPFRSGFGCLSLWEDGDHVCLYVDVPGLTIEEIELIVEDGKLWIRGGDVPCPADKSAGVTSDLRETSRRRRPRRLRRYGKRSKPRLRTASSPPLPKKSEAKAQRIPIQTASMRIRR